MPVFVRKFSPFLLAALVLFSAARSSAADEKSLIPALSSLPAAPKEADKGTPVQIKGDAVEYFQEGQKAVGTGHVTIDYEGTHLEADKITVYMNTKLATADGHAVLPVRRREDVSVRVHEHRNIRR